jgi:hypothetical protein
MNKELFNGIMKSSNINKSLAMICLDCASSFKTITNNKNCGMRVSKRLMNKIPAYYSD